MPIMFCPNRNFHWVTKLTKSNPKKKKKKRVAEPIVRAAATTADGDETNEDNKDVINVNQYVSSMLAVSLGLKLADSTRRDSRTSRNLLSTLAYKSKNWAYFNK
jgi:uncharacterized Zn finger protein (UPF0148 family)